ncbi:MAG: cupin domain-containing protein [Pseudomonadota bacterium]
MPTLHALIAKLDFLPRWRVDDVMVSLSAAGGGVGPHVDQYDVFLLQAKGRRSWAYGGPASPLVPGQPLRLLSGFEPQDQHDLESGDMLYLPPGVPHDGVALDDNSVTLSIGFRAPGLSDLASKLADQLLARWHNDAEGEPRFTDAGRRQLVDNTSEIAPDDVRAMADLLAACSQDLDQMTALAGELVSEPRMPPHPPAAAPDGTSIRRRLCEGDVLERWAGSRLAHGALSDGQSVLFADGLSIPCPGELARILSSSTSIDLAAISGPFDADAVDGVLAQLVEQGTFGFADQDRDAD